MIEAELAIQCLRECGFRLFSGTPCSYLTPFTNSVLNAREMSYVNAANEGDAVAVAIGAELGGVGSGVLFQNSGLGNAVNPLTSLACCFKIPILILVSWRGQPDGAIDEPQHELMGRITPGLLEMMGIAWKTFPTEQSELARTLRDARDHMTRTGYPFALIVKKNSVVSDDSPTTDSCHPPVIRPLPQTSFEDTFEQDEVLHAIQSHVKPQDAVIATTGFTGRALYALDDRPNQFYMVGSMGCAASLGLGLALAQPQRRVIVIDGDGSLLMRLGAMACLGQSRPPNLVHLILDNGAHDSTGGQPTLAGGVDFPNIAQACAYPRVGSVSRLQELAEALEEETSELTFLHMRTNTRQNRKLPRPTMSPPQLTDRFRKWIQSSSMSCASESIL